ncbi:CoA ester lyase [Actinoplanes lobatus]|uniref:Citrate lyase subunit beta/citryl-CoA lyase n=1 Tax=Actinoplanes lobatus TaxID=113568 RepID=A0A7W7HGZ0_9ACTN|nr:CoA ester lyase [Actinoplanes lobatus]MBB4750373.1 citrate lyase subunit beta/citryl-CoA lyase [Actinoplanes lobatus]GGN71671.1 CoA ester lyase [Actinoplanes lobatus]GIE41834.1 CoA ester lyase [Actinoplanes lobatus]
MRSFLYVPGNQPKMLAAALTRGADALIVDLEDAVPPGEKQAARHTVAEWLRSLPAGAPVWVRVNSGPDGLDDARAVIAPAPRGDAHAVPTPALRGDAHAVPTPALRGDAHAVPTPALRGLVVAKASLDQLTGLGGLLDEHDPAGAVGLVPLLETPQAILAAAAIASAPRVTRLQIGEADLSAELGITPGDQDQELLFVRSSVVLASAAAGIEPPAAAVTTDFRDLDALRRSTLALKRLGFRGRACIHPAQIPVVHDVFTPTAEEIATARDLITRFESAGGGVCLDARGRMVDLAVIREARRTLSLAPAVP